MLRTTVYLDEGDKRALEAKSRSTGLSEAELIRRALRSSLRTDESTQAPAFVALGASKPAVARLDKKAMRKRWARQLASKGK